MTVTDGTGTISTQMSVCDNCEIQVKGAATILAPGNDAVAIQDVKLSVQTEKAKMQPGQPALHQLYPFFGWIKSG